MAVKATVGKPSRGPLPRGRRPDWTATRLAALWAAVELLKAKNPRLSDRSACDHLANSPSWQEFSRSRLQKELISAREFHSKFFLAEVISEEEDPEIRRNFLEWTAGLKDSKGA